jgi:hypothetical protein
MVTYREMAKEGVLQYSTDKEGCVHLASTEKSVKPPEKKQTDEKD